MVWINYFKIVACKCWHNIKGPVRWSKLQCTTTDSILNSIPLLSIFQLRGLTSVGGPIQCIWRYNHGSAHYGMVYMHCTLCMHCTVYLSVHSACNVHCIKFLDCIHLTSTLWSVLLLLSSSCTFEQEFCIVDKSILYR